ncbi:hypothetical protein ACH5RR_037404 [Cinchona calisaya]|uniref:Uncharacterized protein n=1 Tax=Cinchona calisaya TaxID=153742 RepID=A0ABD2Y7G8_9GENT
MMSGSSLIRKSYAPDTLVRCPLSLSSRTLSFRPAFWWKAVRQSQKNNMLRILDEEMGSKPRGLSANASEVWSDCANILSLGQGANERHGHSIKILLYNMMTNFQVEPTKDAGALLNSLINIYVVLDRDPNPIIKPKFEEFFQMPDNMEDHKMCWESW